MLKGTLLKNKERKDERGFYPQVFVRARFMREQ